MLIKNSRIRTEYDRVKYLHLLALFLTVLFLIGSGIFEHNFGLFSFLGWTAIFTFLSYFSYLSLQKLNYTYWSMMLISVLGHSIFMFDYWAEGHFWLFYCSISSLGILIYEMWMLHTPIYYPIVNWWDFDFRFRYDLKCRVKKFSDWENSRIVDLRREACCLASFENYKSGDILDFKITHDNQAYLLKGEVISNRLYSVGRPNHYGILFYLTTDNHRRDYQKLEKIWREIRESKRLLKFESSDVN